MIDIKIPDSGDVYLDKFQDVTNKLDDIFNHSLDDEKEQVLVRTDFLRDINFLLGVGYRAYVKQPMNDLHEINKTLKEILREMRKRKV